MISFLIKRLAWMVLTLWVVFTISFLLIRTVPGGPFSRERKLTPEVEANMKRKYNLDAPLYVQYRNQLADTLTGDLGISMRMSDYTVNQVVAVGLPVSVALGVMALVFALLLGLAAGIGSSVLRGTPIDFALMSFATIGIALPNFVIAGILIILFVFLIPLFPAAGWGSLRQIILPAFCLGAPYAAYIARLTRTGMLDVLSQDYIRTAYAKGLPRPIVITKHALQGAMLPVASFLGPAIAGILTGSIVVERIFAIPGLGTHFINAAIDKDYTLAMGMVLLYTILLYTMNMLVDMCYAVLDPRVKLE